MTRSPVHCQKTMPPMGTRAPVKKSRCGLKLSRKSLRTGQNMQIVDDNAPAQIEEVLAHTSIASTTSLPLTDMGQSMLDGYPFAQLGASLHGLLALS